MIKLGQQSSAVVQRPSPIFTLPNELLFKIFENLEGVDHICLALTCKKVFLAGISVDLKPGKNRVDGSHIELVQRLGPSIPTTRYKYCDMCCTYKAKHEGCWPVLSVSGGGKQLCFRQCNKCDKREKVEMAKSKQVLERVKRTLAESIELIQTS